MLDRQKIIEEMARAIHETRIKPMCEGSYALAEAALEALCRALPICYELTTRKQQLEAERDGVEIWHAEHIYEELKSWGDDGR